MDKILKAKIKWLSKEQGGRQTIPWGDKYGPIVVLKETILNSSETVWSLLVSNKELISDVETIAEINYLSENAPDNLSKDVEFELYEGSKFVGEGIVL